MSLINLLDKDEIWLDFLNHKINSSHLPIKTLNEYKNFIENKKYKNIVKKIIEEEYSFSIPKKIMIGKMGKSKKRVVYMFSEEETYILKLLTYLLYKYDYFFSPNLYSFRKKSGVKRAIYNLTKCHINKLYGYKLDIKNYFNSINTDILLSNLKNDLNDNKLYNLFEKILQDKRVIFNNEVIIEEKGAMAGVPISAFFANYYLKELDKYFYENNIIYARYADDIIIFDKSFDKILEHQNFISNFLENLNLKINKEKEFFYKPGDEFEFLGFSYKNGTIDLSSNTIKKIKGKIKRSAKGFRRWMIRKNANYDVTVKAINRKFNRKFYGKNENDLTWKYWFFPVINTSKSLKIVDNYMQDWQRYIITGKHNKKNYEKVPYTFLKQCNYKSLVNEFYNYKKNKVIK